MGFEKPTRKIRAAAPRLHEGNGREPRQDCAQPPPPRTGHEGTPQRAEPADELRPRTRALRPVGSGPGTITGGAAFIVADARGTSRAGTARNLAYATFHAPHGRKGFRRNRETLADAAGEIRRDDGIATFYSRSRANGNGPTRRSRRTNAPVPCQAKSAHAFARQPQNLQGRPGPLPRAFADCA